MSTAAAFRTYLSAAHTALNGGEALDCERLAKAVVQLVRAERDVAEYLTDLRNANEHDGADAIAAELRRRLSLLADADRAGRPAEVLAAIAATGTVP